jgi:2,4-diketo-3-deoxy-L-fuconate hydrolase
MKLASIRHEGRERVVVALDDEHVVDVNDLGAPVSDMLDLIEQAPSVLPALTAALASFRRRADETRLIPTSQVVWRPPVRRPGKICGVAMNNSASNARKIKAPDHPAFFLKPSSCLVGHLQPIRIHEYYGSTHPEPELAVVIGRGGREIRQAQALDAVFGYTICNDVTSNGMRGGTRGATPSGPWGLGS